MFPKKSKTANLSTDENLLLRNYRLSGDLSVLAELYSPYMPLVYGVCMGYFKDEERSKDAVMEVFEELVVKLKAHVVSNFKSWLYVLCRNHCLMALRKDKQHSSESLDDNFMEIEEPVHLDINVEKESELLLLEHCLQTLGKEQQTSIELFYLQEKCYKEIVELTGYELGKVKSYIQNGKRNLKNCIENKREK